MTTWQQAVNLYECSLDGTVVSDPHKHAEYHARTDGSQMSWGDLRLIALSADYVGRVGVLITHTEPDRDALFAKLMRESEDA